MGSHELKNLVAERAKYICEYCLSQECFSPDPFAIEHIIPKSKGGEDELHNLAYSCQGCNSFKYNHTEAIDPGTGQKSPLFNPRVHIWPDHFTWNENCSLLIGISPIGRTTIDRLKLNRQGVMNLRLILYKSELHPPP